MQIVRSDRKQLDSIKNELLIAARNGNGSHIFRLDWIWLGQIRMCTHIAKIKHIYTCRYYDHFRKVTMISIIGSRVFCPCNWIYANRWRFWMAKSVFFMDANRFWALLIKCKELVVAIILIIISLSIK